MPSIRFEGSEAVQSSVRDTAPLSSRRRTSSVSSVRETIGNLLVPLSDEELRPSLNAITHLDPVVEASLYIQDALTYSTQGGRSAPAAPAQAPPGA